MEKLLFSFYKGVNHKKNYISGGRGGGGAKLSLLGPGGADPKHEPHLARINKNTIFLNLAPCGEP